MFKIKVVDQDQQVVVSKDFESYIEAKAEADNYNKEGHYVFIYNTRQLKAFEEKNNIRNNSKKGINKETLT